MAESQRQTTELQLRSNQSGGSDQQRARVAVVQARASLDIAQSRLDYTLITTPVAGIELTRNVKPGITIRPGKLLMTLSPSGDSDLVVQIDEKNLALLRLGQKSLALADAYPDRRFAAEISFTSPTLDPLRSSLEVRLRVTEAPEYLRHEMTISVDIERLAGPMC